MKKTRKDSSESRNFKYSEAFKIKVVSDINQGLYSVLGAMRKYQIGGKMTVYKWLAKYNPSSRVVNGGGKMKKKNNSSNTDTQTRIRYLEKLVSDLSIENKILKTTIKVADETYNTDLKKNFVKESLAKHTKKQKEKK